jgi:hypothetical protein
MMTDQQRIKEIIILTASYFRQTISAPVLEMYVDDLIDLPADRVINAYKTFRRDPKNKTCPLPSQIRDIVMPAKTPESSARDDAARIQQAIVKYGYSNPLEAESFLGSKVWAVVQSFGGWNYICTNHGVNIDPTTFYAQARERLGDVHKHDFGYNDKQLTSHQENELIDSQAFQDREL